MTQASEHAPARLTRGKLAHLVTLSNRYGIIAATAIDHRTPLHKAIEQAKGTPVSAAELGEFKALLAEVLSPHASAILTDPEYGLGAIDAVAPGVGVMLAYEKTGYDFAIKGRLPDLLPAWSVQRLVEAGANGIKILLYYDPDDDPAINTIKQAYVERIGAECRANDVPFFLEPITYSDEIADVQGLAFARVKPAKVTAAMREFSQPRYGVDILKVEVPITARYLEGSTANIDGAIVYTRAQAMELLRVAASASQVPFIYLSAGVTDTVFRELLQLAATAGVAFAGVLCGRATWQDGIAAYAAGGAATLRAWLHERGVPNVAALNGTLSQTATPWWDFYGGKEHLEIVAGTNHESSLAES